MIRDFLGALYWSGGTQSDSRVCFCLGPALHKHLTIWWNKDILTISASKKCIFITSMTLCRVKKYKQTKTENSSVCTGVTHQACVGTSR